MIGKLRHFDLL